MESREVKFKFDKTAVSTTPSNPKFADEERRLSLGAVLGVGDKLLVPAPDDRAHESEKGMCFYWRSDWCGIRLPFSKFVVEILRTLNVAPAQLNAVAWCHINSFEALFRSHDKIFGNLPDKIPTLSLFLEFYEFARSGSWIGIRKQTDRFISIRKIEDWSKGFFFLPHSEVTPELLGNVNVRTSWNDHVILPGRRYLNMQERRMQRLVEKLYEDGILVYSFMLFQIGIIFGFY
jgi:hypothetical protein